MLIYVANRRPNEVVDCYLDQLQAAPGSDAVLWATYVLEYSSKCGGTAEVLDAMRHARRFHPEVQGLRGLDSVLDDWAAGHAVAQAP